MPLIIIQKCPAENASGKISQAVKQQGGRVMVGSPPGRPKGRMLGSGVCKGTGAQVKSPVSMIKETNPSLLCFQPFQSSHLKDIHLCSLEPIKVFDTK